MGKQLRELERGWERHLGTEAGGIWTVARESFLCSQEEDSIPVKGQLVLVRPRRGGSQGRARQVGSLSFKHSGAESLKHRMGSNCSCVGSTLNSF